MIDEVRICGRKLFHHDMWRVRINDHKWLYDSAHDCFMEKNGGKVISKEDMPSDVQLGFHMAWDKNDFVFCEKYSARHSYGWKLMLDGLQKEGYDVVVFSRGHRMGVLRMSRTKNSLTEIPIAPVLV